MLLIVDAEIAPACGRLFRVIELMVLQGLSGCAKDQSNDASVSCLFVMFRQDAWAELLQGTDELVVRESGCFSVSLATVDFESL